MSEIFGLKRDLGLGSAAAIVVGTVIGSGIFLVPSTMIQNVGSTRMLFAVWIVGGLLSMFGALSYAELAAALPEAGGEYVYLREAYGPLWAFLYGWTQMWVAKSGSIATLATGFFIYLSNFRPELAGVLAVIPLPLGENGKPLEISYGQIMAIGVVAVLAFINYFGVKVGGNVQVVVTIIKVGLIAAIIVIGLGSGHGDASHFGDSTTTAVGGIAGFFAALVAALWAYDGWNNVSMVSSEIQKPQRNLPLALIYGTLLVMLIYLLANVAYFYILSPAEVASSPRVASEMMRRILGGWGANAVSVAAMISIFAALNGSILSGSRVPYAMARDGQFFRSVAHVHPVHRTPSVSILALSAWSCVLVLSGRYDQLYTYVIFASAILYGMATASVIVLRYKRPDMPRPYRTLGYPVVPIAFVIAIACLVLSTLVESPRESLMGLGLIALGLPFYFYWRSKSQTEPRPSQGVMPRVFVDSADLKLQIGNSIKQYFEPGGEIFISYASADRPKIQPLVAALERAGWSVWWDRTILPGKIYDEVIEQALDRAKCVIVIWSEKSVASEWVRNEAEEGRKRGILVPVLVQEVKVPLAFRGIQAARLMNWLGDSAELEFQELCQAITERIESRKKGTS